VGDDAKRVNPNQLEKDQNKIYLASSLLFKNLPGNELEYVVEKSNLVEIPDGNVLIHEGEQADHFYVVVSGEFEVIKALGTDDERLIAVHGAGQFLGELGLLNPDGLRTASIRSRGPAKLWMISYNTLDELLHRFPKLAYSLMQMVSVRLSSSENDLFSDLIDRNRQLSQAYAELVAAQEQILEKERLERELHVAHQIQMSILPQTLPEIQGYEFGARIVPARAVGGDFFDVFPLNDDLVAVFIGDVADKGVPSAIFMARVHALLVAEAGHCRRAAEALLKVNRHLIEITQTSLFVTVLFGILDVQSGRFSYARGGHELPVIVDTNGGAYLAPKKQGQLLGFLENPELDEQEVFINPGGMVVLYTDGIIDARSPKGEPFGYERMLETIDSLAGVTSQRVCDGLLERVVEYQDRELQDDDITLVVVKTRQEAV
jgi:phosphoserine phosphatase RsbU/P